MVLKSQLADAQVLNEALVKTNDEQTLEIKKIKTEKAKREREKTRKQVCFFRKVSLMAISGRTLGSLATRIGAGQS